MIMDKTETKIIDIDFLHNSPSMNNGVYNDSIGRLVLITNRTFDETWVKAFESCKIGPLMDEGHRVSVTVKAGDKKIMCTPVNASTNKEIGTLIDVVKLHLPGIDKDYARRLNDQNQRRAKQEMRRQAIIDFFKNGIA